MNNKIGESEKFFSQLSHDLRGSFTSILGFSDILSDPNEDLNEEEVREFGKRIGIQANESLKLLVNFIKWLKLEKYSALLNLERLDLSEVVSEIITSNRQKMESLNITPVKDLIDPYYVFMDYEILISILNNIIDYLLQFCKENSQLKFSSLDQNNNIILKVSASTAPEKIAILKETDFNNPNSENAFPLIFAFKFIELCGGELKFSSSSEDINLQLSVPQNKI